MRTRNLPILLFLVLIIITGCKKNNLKILTTTPPCSGPGLLKENMLPAYIKLTNGSFVYDAIASDQSGNVYVENTSQGFSPTNATGGISGIIQGYLYKFDDLGNQVYSKPAVTSNQSVMAVDSMQNIYIGYLTILTSPYHCIVNATKYNITGDTAWSKRIYYDEDALFTSLGVSNSGVLHVAANDISAPLDTQYNDPTAQVEPGSGSMVYTFDPTGKLTQVKQIALFPDFSPGIYQFVPSGDYYYFTYSNNTTSSNVATVNEYDITSKLLNTYTLPVPAYASVFYDNELNIYSNDSTSVTKYTAGLTPAWSIKTQPFKLVKTDGDGNLYIAGTFNGSVNFNPAGTAKTLTAHGINDSFIEKIDANGKMVWVIQSLGTNGKTYTGASQIDNFLVTAKNKIFVTGSALNKTSNTTVHFAALYTQCN